jgi:hypothetical protein
VGTFIWESGNKFIGNYEKDQREGYGEMQWNDGSVYKGFWARGLQDGDGVLITADGKRKEGRFSSNKFVEAKIV